MVLLGTRAERMGNPRFGAANEVVTEGGKILERAK